MKIITPSILLIRPQLGENIGAAARVMKNFGFTDLRIVAPRDGWPNAAAEAMAAGGVDIIQSASIHKTTAQAVADLTYVYATTARERGMDKEAITLQQLPEHLKRFLGGGDAVVRNAQQRPPHISTYNQEDNRCQEPAKADDPIDRSLSERRFVGIMFGPERSGLENEDLVHANTLVSVPVNPDYPSLNLAQAVALICYELSDRKTESHEAVAPDRHIKTATKAELQGFFDHLEAELDARNFWRVAEKKAAMWVNIRNLFQRAGLTDQEIRTLRGIVRSLSER